MSGTFGDECVEDDMAGNQHSEVVAILGCSQDARHDEDANLYSKIQEKCAVAIWREHCARRRDLRPVTEAN